MSMPNSIHNKNQDVQDTSFASMPMYLEAPTESTMVNSIMNDENLSTEQKRKLLEERMANLPPEQRKELEKQKHMSKLDWVLMGLMPGANWATRKIIKHVPKEVVELIPKKMVDKAHKIINNKSLLFETGQVAKDNSIQEMAKQGIIRGGEEAEKIINNTEKELEYEARKLLYPKIPYIDY
jgi:hypothetical protein